MAKGLKFIPSPKNINKAEIYKALTILIRKIMLYDYFRDDPKEKVKLQFKGPSHWTPPMNMISEGAKKLIAELKKTTATTVALFPSRNNQFINTRQVDNLGPSLREGLKTLKNNPDIIIKPADKGGRVCVLNRTDYIREAERQLYNPKYYQEIDRPKKHETIPAINATLEALLHMRYLKEEQADYLAAAPTDEDRYFYLLPKIHKPPEKWPSPKMPEGRPIVGDCATENRRVCDYIDSFLSPLATQHDSYLQDTYHFIRKIRHTRVDPNHLLVTGDITALYTNMCIERILQTVQDEMRRHPDPERPDGPILDLLKTTLENNDFYFNKKLFLQIHGTAMGYPYAPNLANIYLLEFDEKIRTGFKIRPHLYVRFLDDIFFLWPGTTDELEEFGNYINTLIPDIRVTLTHHTQEIAFLDTTVFKHTDTTDPHAPTTTLQTKVYFKPTDSHQLLHFHSFHPTHTQKGILKSQLIRFKRLSSFKADYDHSAQTLFDHIRHRGYSTRLFRRYKNGIWHNRLPPPKPKNTGPTLPIVILYSGISQKLGRTWRETITKYPQFKNHNIIIAYRRNRNLRDILAPSKLKTPDRTDTATPTPVAPGPPNGTG